MIRDIGPRNASLANDYGATKGPNAAASHQFAVFEGDPSVDGVELTGGGYARVTLPNDGTVWPAPVGGQLTITVDLPLTGEPTGIGDHFALFDAADGTSCWDTGPLSTDLLYTAAGTYQITITIVSEDD